MTTFEHPAVSVADVGFHDWTYTFEPEVARVVATEVSLYTAHWDSGQPDTPAVIIHLWDGKVLTQVKLPTDSRTWDNTGWYYGYSDGPKYGPPRRFLPPAITVTAEDLIRIDAYRAVGKYIDNVLRRVAKTHKIGHGVQVRVVKGRKAPKGDGYEVTKHDAGGYGAYVNLRDRAGNAYSFVATGKVEVVPDHAWTFADMIAGPEHGMLLAIADAPYEQTAWFALAEFLLEHDYVPASSGPTDIAFMDTPAWRQGWWDALANAAISDEPRRLWNTVHENEIDRHNNLRTLRYGS